MTICVYKYYASYKMLLLKTITYGIPKKVIFKPISNMTYIIAQSNINNIHQNFVFVEIKTTQSFNFALDDNLYIAYQPIPISIKKWRIRCNIFSAKHKISTLRTAYRNINRSWNFIVFF